MSHPVLDLEMQPNDANVKTVRDYLKSLLKLVWLYDEEFDGKRPFGNSGWKSEIYETLALSELIESEIDHYGETYITDAGVRDGDYLIGKAISDL